VTSRGKGKREQPAPPKWLVEGVMVDYHSVIDGPPTQRNMRVLMGPEMVSSGHWVVWLVDKAGYVSVDAVTPAGSTTSRPHGGHPRRGGTR